MNVLTTRGLSKSYGTLQAVADLDLSIPSGTVYGLLGPNGSGKTTTLGMVLGIIKADQGTFEWFGGKYGDYSRLQLGCMLERPSFYPNLHADDNLALIKHIKQSRESNFDDLLELVNLRDRRRTPFQGYSLGMRQRLALAAALIGDPQALILDEPTNGLDPQGIADVRTVIRQIAGSGKTILLASHMLDEVEKVCSHVAILKAGRLIADGPVHSILAEGLALEIAGSDMPALQRFLQELPGIGSVVTREVLLEVTVERNWSAASLNRHLVEHGLEISHLREKRQTLEEGFLQLVK